MRIPSMIYLSGPIIDTIETKLGQIEDLLITLLSVIAVWMVTKTFFRTGALVAAVVAIVAGAVVLWGVNNIDYLKTKLDGELKAPSSVGPLTPGKAGRPSSSPYSRA